MFCLLNISNNIKFSGTALELFTYISYSQVSCTPNSCKISTTSRIFIWKGLKRWVYLIFFLFGLLSCLFLLYLWQIMCISTFALSSLASIADFSPKVSEHVASFSKAVRSQLTKLLQQSWNVWCCATYSSFLASISCRYNKFFDSIISNYLITPAALYFQIITLMTCC